MYYHDPFTVVAAFLPPAILVCLLIQLVLYLPVSYTHLTLPTNSLV